MSLVDVTNPASDPCGLATHQQHSGKYLSWRAFFTEFQTLKLSTRLFTRICSVSDLQENELYRYEVGDRTLLVARIDRRIVVTDAICTHEEADLTLGIFTGRTVTCPLHQAKFDLESGAVLSGPNGDAASSIPELKVYNTKIENGNLLADL